MITFLQFETAAKSQGLTARDCSTRECQMWQVRGGERLVNFWPFSKKRTIALPQTGQKEHGGSVQRALELAGKPSKHIRSPQPIVNKELTEEIPLNSIIPEYPTRTSSATLPTRTRLNPTEQPGAALLAYQKWWKAELVEIRRIREIELSERGI